VTKPDLERQVREAFRDGFDAGNVNDDPATSTLAPGGYGYRATGGGARQPNIPFTQAIATAWALDQSNPLAKRGLDIRRDYVIGGGVTAQAADPALQEIIDEFWQRNDMARQAPKLVRQLFLFGAQCYPAFVRGADGRVLLGYIDPAQIETVIPHPDNAMQMWAVVIGETPRTQPWETQYAKRVYRVIRQDVDGHYYTAAQTEREPWEDTLLAHYGLADYSGDCFYYKINDVVNQEFGVSELAAIADWADQHDETLFALGDREQMGAYFSWDVTLTGADEATVKKVAKDRGGRAPKLGTVNFHNESETWTMNYPDLKQSGSIGTADAMRTQAWGGLGYPVAWFGTPQGTHLATAQAQGDPTWRMLDYLQGVVEQIFSQMLEFARDQAVVAGAYTPDAETDSIITMLMPEMTTRDVTAAAGALAGVASALITAQTQDWITKAEAAAIFAKVAAELDVEIDTARLSDEESGALTGDAPTLLKDFMNTHPLFTGADNADAAGTV